LLQTGVLSRKTLIFKDISNIESLFKLLVKAKGKVALAVYFEVLKYCQRPLYD